MNDFKKWIIDNNRITAPLLSILFSMLIVLVSLVVPLAIYTVPVAVFFTFHYTRIFRIRTRVFGSLLVFFIVAVFATAIFSHIIYNSSPTTVNTTPGGTSISASVTPFSGSHNQFNFSLIVTPAEAINYNSTVLIINSTAYSEKVTFSQMKSFVDANGNTVIYYNNYNLPSGLYYYNFTIYPKAGGLITTGLVNGPINTNELGLYQSLLPSFIIEYVIYFELIFGIGLLIGRSISHSRRYEPPREQTKEE